ncbi:MAG: undecaprenyldiphospho-muramoylpentapeptide beta-N-acetylglucosaminyltransferase [Clostridia bacterium]|nr:undecaprenyldiphospho-muramoylpentapeptide beta-N-acetylglucosaminyltransferase [Clostridia bacterium]
MRVIIAAAGTAGHINPGLAIANKIKKEQPNSEIIFIGTSRGLENDLVPRAGYELKTIEAYGLSKKISFDNLKKLVKTFIGMGQAKKIVKQFKPDIVIGTGGYICGAVITAASKQGIPTLLHESNAFPGKAVKMLAKRTDTILVSFQDAKDRIPDAKNIVCTGTPVKIKKQNYGINEKNEIIKENGLNASKPIVLVYGGSQGAQKINEALTEIIKKKLNKNYQVIWATGPKQYDIIKENLGEIDIENIENMKVVPYIYDMEKIMNIADLIVARSGAMTITEISNLGKASILVPLPNVSNNHQMYNAKVLEKINAAEIIENDNMNGELLNKTINEIVSDKEKIKLMGASAYSISIKDTQDKIFKEILALLNRNILKQKK